jgi:hypothetical protein
MWGRLSLVFTRSWKLVPAFAHERYFNHAEDGDGGETGESWGLRPLRRQDQDERIQVPV